jgi:hypothetical protein
MRRPLGLAAQISTEEGGAWISTTESPARWQRLTQFQRPQPTLSATTGGEPPKLAAARKEIGELARRLRRARALTDAKRRTLLADLTGRLTALIGELIAHNVPTSAVSELTALVAAIEAGGPVGPMLDATLHALDDFAGHNAAPDTRHRALWKRG